MKQYILYIAKNYSFEILRPIQAEIKKRGHQCIWFADPVSVDLNRFSEDEVYFTSPSDVKGYKSCAVFCPGNNVPGFLSGIKVQVFHGLEWKKKGHFRIRDFFDIYCTQGAITTTRFSKLAQEHQNFIVKETGWSKLDPLFSVAPYKVDTDKKVVLYAPTFSEKLTSAPSFIDVIKKLSASGDYYWLVKFHPLMNKDVVAKYKSIENIEVVDDHSILPLLVRADIMVSDTSSVIGEFMLLDKVVVAINNSVPDDSMINIQRPDQLHDALNLGLNEAGDFRNKITSLNELLHPYKDGLSSARILDAVDDFLSGNIPKKRKPINIFRKLKIRSHYKYWSL